MKKILLIIFVIFIVPYIVYANSSYCYQEYFNVSTACGGLSTGTVFLPPGAYSDPQNIFDGNYSTAAIGVTGEYIYYNYTKPPIAIEAKWRVSDDVDGSGTNFTRNYTLPLNCFHGNPTNIMLRSRHSNTGFSEIYEWQCYNSSAEWYTLNSSSTVPGTGIIYEEAIFWQIPNILIDNCTDYNYSILNFTYLDEIENTTLSVNGGHNLVFSGYIDQLYNFTFNNKHSHEYCTVVNLSNLGETVNAYGTITLSLNEYATEVYEISESDPLIAVNNPKTRQPIYMIKVINSSTIVYTWLTSTYESIDGTMLIYECTGDGNKNLVSSLPIINGQVEANQELLYTAYSYEVVYDDQVYIDNTDFSKCHVETQTEREYIIDIGSDISPIIGIYSIVCNLTKTGNDTVKLEWGTNPENTGTITGCIYAQRISVAGSSNIYTNCTSTSNSIERTIPSSGFTYNVYGKVFQSGYSMQCENAIEFNAEKTAADTLGLTGIFAIILIIVGMVLIFSNEQPIYYPIVAAVSLITAFILGITAFGWITVSALLFFVIIIILVGRYHKKE